MYLDALLRVANGQTFNGASEVSADSVDLGVTPASGVPARRVGTGEPLVLAFFVETSAAATGAGTAVYAINAVQADNDALSSNKEVIASVSRTEAQLVAGAVVIVDIPINTPTRRYIGGEVDLPLSASTVVGSMFIGPRSFVDAWIAYKKGYVS